MKPKKSYKTVPAAAVVREYRRDVILTWVLHVLTIPLASLFLWLGISGRITLFNGILTAAGALFANYLIRVLRSYKLNPSSTRPSSAPSGTAAGNPRSTP